MKRNRGSNLVLILVIVGLVISACQQPQATPTSTSGPTATATPPRLSTPTRFPTPTPAPIPTATPSPTPAPTATPTPSPTPTSRVASVAQVGNFSVAVRKFERKGDSAVVHFVITKVTSGATNSEQIPQKLQVTLKDDHNNEYSGMLTTDLSVAPPEVVSQTPLGFSYTDSVAISIPEKAPIQTIRFGSGKEFAFKDVQFVEVKLKEGLSEASIRPGDVAFRGKYLTVGTAELAGAATGWVLPLKVTNTEYSPLKLELRIGLQLGDGKIIWVQDASSTVAVPGSGSLNLLPRVWSLSDALNWISPAKLILYLHAPSSSERAFKLMPLTLEQFPILPERIALVCGRNLCGLGAQVGPEVYVMTVDGSSRTRIAKGFSPDWSPDGYRLIIDGGYIMNGDGQNAVKIAAGEFSDPAWSRDGKRITFRRGFGYGFGSDTGLWVMNADGSGERRIRETVVENPTWSPDDQKITFTASRCGQCKTGIYQISSDRTATYEEVFDNGRLSSKEDREFDPDWSPDGTKIAFSVNKGGYYWTHREDQYIVSIKNADRSGMVELVEGRNPTWSPDGTKIAFDGKDGIYVMNAHGSGLRKLGQGTNPSWAPALKLTENGLVPLGVAHPGKGSASNSSATSQVLTIKVKHMQAGSGCLIGDPGLIETLGLENDYLPEVVASENGAAGVSLEALKAQAVVSRTFAIYKMQYEPRSTSFDVCDTEADQVYNPSVKVTPEVWRAVEETKGVVAKWNREVIAAFFVKGDARTAGYVTVNEGKRGADVKPTTLGSPVNTHNRGAMSQDKANALAAQGWDYQRILRYFYGADLVLSP